MATGSITGLTQSRGQTAAKDCGQHPTSQQVNYKIQVHSDPIRLHNSWSVCSSSGVSREIFFIFGELLLAQKVSDHIGTDPKGAHAALR